MYYGTPGSMNPYGICNTPYSYEPAGGYGFSYPNGFHPYAPYESRYDPYRTYGTGYLQPGSMWYPHLTTQGFEMTVSFRNHQIINPSTRQTDDPFSVVAEQVNAEKTKKWNKVPDLWTNQLKPEIESYLAAPDNRDNREGMLSIENAEIVAHKPISNQLASAISNLDYYVENYGEVQAYYVAVNYRVEKESEFFQNGINYLVATVVKEDDKWKMAEFSVAPIDIIRDSGEGFDTVDERRTVLMQKMNEYGGLIVNKAFKTLSMNTPAEYLPSTEELSTAHRTPPSKIKVAISNPANGRVGSVITVDFNEYVRNVLPNEWELDSGREALKAGAMAVKMYAWFFTKYPGVPGLGAHVRDSTRHQAYIKNTPAGKKRITEPAISDVNKIGMFNKTKDCLFLSEYRSNGQGVHWKGSGKVSQKGSKRLERDGKNFKQILDFYYTNSTRLLRGKLDYFQY
jgi:hypothetical protein